MRASESPALLELDSVTFSYGNVQVLFGVELDVRRGEVLAIIGPNGAGKTTLLRVIAGLEMPDSGRLSFDGDSLERISPEQRARLGISAVFAGNATFEELTVNENLLVGAYLLGADDACRRDRIAEVYELFPNLFERRANAAAKLSGGERQMLSIGKSFLLRPKLLLIDELSLGLAPLLIERLIESLRAINDAGTTVLLVEQAAHVAASIADRGAVMERGAIEVVVPGQELPHVMAALATGSAP